MSKPFAWSYSALVKYEQCPKQYYHTTVVKDFKEAKTEQLDYGTRVHEALHKRVVKGTPLPLEFRHLEATASKIAAAEGEKHGELKLALTRDFAPTEFFARDVYVRAIIDLAVVRDNAALVIDYKTGKVKDDFTQLELASAVLSIFMPDIERFRLSFLWLKEKTISTQERTREDLAGIWADLIKRSGAIESALATTTFPAKPSPLCRWCPVQSCPHQPPARP